MPSSAGEALAGLEIGDAVLEMGSALLMGIGIVIVLYVLLRVYFETKRGLEREPAKTERRKRCPNCEEPIPHDGELISTCADCGWKPGWPGLRWVTRSLPAQELRRSITVTRVIALGLAVALLWGGTFGAGLAIPESPDPVRVNEMDTADVEPLNTTEVEILIVAAVNEERTKSGLSELDFEPVIANATQKRAETMVTQDSIGQEFRTDDRRADQYGEVCEGPVGETAAGVWYGSAFSTWNSDGEVYLSSEADLARFVLERWRSADGSHSTMLSEDWKQTGVGVAVREDGKVVVVQAYC